MEFKTFVRADNALTSVGVVRNLVGADGIISFIPKNLKDATKRVALVLTKADGTSTVATCSKAVSEGLRSKTITLSEAANFEVLKNTEGVEFISLPSTGGALISFAVKDLTVTNYVPKTVNFNELIAL